MKNKKMWVITGVIVLLAAAVAVFALLNAQALPQQDDVVRIVFGQTQKTVSLADLQAIGAESFTATVNAKGQEPKEIVFTGVPLIEVLRHNKIDIDGMEQAVFKAADGFASAASTKEVEEADNIYIVFERDAEPSGSMQQGGTGPFEIVIRNDPFPQRWCRNLVEIEIQ